MADEPVNPEHFLHQTNPRLHTTDPIERTVLLSRKRGEKTSLKPDDKIRKWLSYLEYINLKSQSDPDAINRIKQYYLDRLVIQPKDVPEEFTNLQVKLHLEAHPTEKVTEALKVKLIEIAIEDQKESLDKWLDFLLSERTREFPMWLKYWSLSGLTKLGKFDQRKISFKTRDKTSLAPFPELNEEAFSKMIDLLMRRNSGQEFAGDTDPALIAILKDVSFAKLYGYTLKSVTSLQEGFGTNDGAWKIYPRGSSIEPFVKDLKGKNSGWCSAGKNSARVHLAGGDFYIYYSNDKDGEPTVPRIAIRMLGSRIWEVRGVAYNQHLDSQIASTNTLQTKLQEFGRVSDRYLEALESLNRINDIEKRIQEKTELTTKDLKFLYQIDSSIKQFGNRTDNRIKDLIRSRNMESDIALLLSKDISQIKFYRLTKKAWRWQTISFGKKTFVYLYNRPY